MSVKVLIPAPMRAHAGGNAEVEVNAANVRAALDELGARFPSLRDRVFDGDKPRRFLNLYLNDDDVRYLDDLSTATKDGDELSIVPAVAGG
jgi:molybdopterin converting factor small subunit